MARMVTAILAGAVLASALAVVYAKHESRKRYVELQAAWKQRDTMNDDWGRLQLELGAWATHSRVERLARQELSMTLPTPDAVVIVRP